MTDEPTTEQLEELLEKVAPAKRFAREINCPIWADLADAENWLTDRLGVEEPGAVR